MFQINVNPFSMPPLQTENRGHYGKTSWKFSCGHEHEDQIVYSPPASVQEETTRDLKNGDFVLLQKVNLDAILQNDANVDLAALNRMEDTRPRRELREIKAVAQLKTPWTTNLRVINDYDICRVWWQIAQLSVWIPVHI
ncbi:hypothetical protein VTN77DRAFT_2928 [Rasamsonia byssochlamydoides]|uniref:uncharacterized protein n=1 Tax=Rasamsonia byssochlamydoides TaxID=89139 RepID=UPI0037430C2A